VVLGGFLWFLEAICFTYLSELLSFIYQATYTEKKDGLMAVAIPMKNIL
jgi:hypothetical protein